MSTDTHLPITPITMKWEGDAASPEGWLHCKMPGHDPLLERLPSFATAHRIHNALQQAYELGRQQGRTEIKQAVERL